MCEVKITIFITCLSTAFHWKSNLHSQIKPVVWRFLHSSTPLRASPCTSDGYSTSVHGSAAPCAVMQCDSWRLGTLPAGGKSNVCALLFEMVAHITGWCYCAHEERKTDHAGHVHHQRWTAATSIQEVHRVCENYCHFLLYTLNACKLVLCPCFISVPHLSNQLHIPHSQQG